MIVKKLLTFFALVLLLSQTYSQNKFEDWFKYPMERERDPGNPVFSNVPLYDNPLPSAFFNINISQNSQPQNEPSVCISRKNPNRVVAAWRDFRYGVDPVANRRVGYSYSTNSGLTWAQGQILDSTLLPGSTRNSDPVVTVDTAGNFYIAVIAISFPTGALTLAVYKSTNGGVTFPQAFVCSATGSEDKEWITTDLSPVSPFLNHLYISWTSFTLGGIRMVKSTNDGVNWTASPVSVSSPSAPVQGSNICISRNGQVNVVWLEFSTNLKVDFNRSTNGGSTFGTVTTITQGPPPEGLPNDVITCPFIESDITTGPRSGWLYVVFADNRNSDCDVFFTRSTDNGTSWSTPLRVNNDPLNNGKIQYWPVIAVNEAGNLAIIFMDTRNTPDNTIIEAFVARSTDGGFTFTNELVSSDQSPTNIPGSNVRFGDYIDVDYVGQNVVPVWTDERAGGNNMDIFTAEITDVLGTDPAANIPVEYSLKQNYPNPFNPATVIKFTLPENSYIRLELFNSLGQLIKTIAQGSYSTGNHSINFNAGNLSGGVYFYKLTSENYTETKKMMLIK